MDEAYRRIDQRVATCGRCDAVRTELEEKIAKASSDLSISVDDLLKIEILCRKAGVSVAPLESGCYLWRPAENSRRIWITYKWARTREFGVSQYCDKK